MEALFHSWEERKRRYGSEIQPSAQGFPTKYHLDIVIPEREG